LMLEGSDSAELGQVGLVRALPLGRWAIDRRIRAARRGEKGWSRDLGQCVRTSPMDLRFQDLRCLLTRLMHSQPGWHLPRLQVEFG
jgi:hypothetical protein